MMSGHTGTTASEKETNQIFVIPHSKNGRCTNLGCIDELGGMREPDVGRGWGGQ